MIPINIYSLTRLQDPDSIQKMERQMSRRKKPLSVKEWEVAGLQKLSTHLITRIPSFSSMQFYYSFVIPRIGKEFDLLRIGEDSVINLELKSGNVTTEAIKKQLIQNRYYLATLGKSVRSYTYVSEDDKLYRLSNGDNLVESEWERLCEDLEKQTDPYSGHIEDLFLESNYLISPLTDSDKFLNREYFLTYQQRDIRNHILQNLQKKQVMIQGFCGLPGTGKTLLLYDIAMSLSAKQKVCVLHFGFFPKELAYLDSRLKRIDFYPCREISALPDLENYSYILIDEGHQVSSELLDALLTISKEKDLPIIFAYDQEDAIAPEETDSILCKRLANEENFIEYRLTNRIRMNKELSVFIHRLMHLSTNIGWKDYPGVSVVYANDEEELKILLSDAAKEGYEYIVDASDATSKEYAKVVMIMDETFYYDGSGWLRSRENASHRYNVKNLFHGLNRAKDKLKLIIFKNESVLKNVLSILQG